MDEIAVTAWKDGDVPGVPETLDGAALARWGRLCVAGLGRHRDEINALNVFPVADADTGTNLLVTMRAAVAAAEPLAAGSPARAVAGAMARAGTAGARGNSGIILSQVLRGLAEAVQDGPLTAATVRIMLRRAAILVREALSTPVDGTMLTVLEAAADRAADCPPDALVADVALAAADGAVKALGDTTSQLTVLRDAGVVDAGARGLLVLLDALVEVTGVPAPTRPAYEGPIVPTQPEHRSPHPLASPTIPHPAATDHTGRITAAYTDTRPAAPDAAARVAAAGGDRWAGPQYEVMYLLSETDGERIAALRNELAGLGDSVAVVGDGAGAGRPMCIVVMPGPPWRRGWRRGG
ncbi:DAK2 domain-containing protein [Nocardia terpenica]|uniref:DAK2 domain-containing protein n=1 Tax=Nocardia terpenica TaxID=455432 RepID=UPI003D1619EB